MLNANNERELCFITRIDDIKPIAGKDRVECAVVGGWTIMTRLNQFKPGDFGIYFEIDSKTPEEEPFEFLASKHYKVKTQRYKTPVGPFFSQGLLMSAEDFGWTATADGLVDKDGVLHKVDDESRFLTKQLGVVYSVAEDNKRKANGDPNAKYKSMFSRHPKFARSKIGRWCGRHMWAKKLLYIFWGKKKDKNGAWPSHIAAKTDVERIQNMIFVLQDKKEFVATEKVDGSSCSIMAEHTKFGKIKQYVCSRNVVFEKPDDKCFYESNIYFEAYEKYNIGEKIVKMLNDLKLPNIALQMEVYGAGVQKRDYSTQEHCAAIFHIVSSGVKMPMDKVVELCEKYDLPHVPVIDYNYVLPDTIEELQEFVEGAPSAIDGLPKEGIVFYDKETGQQYFKFVSPNFLMKYHG